MSKEESKYFKNVFGKEFEGKKDGTDFEKAEYKTFGKAVIAWKNKYRAIWIAKFYP